MADEAKLREYLRRATADLRKTRRRLSAIEARGSAPLAIVGMGCRFPGGVRSPQDLWELLVDARDAISPFPTDRGWDLQALHDPDLRRPGTSHVREGGFVEDVGDFDAEFFGVSPREALAMDPQQRLLLETSWEALEDAGIDPGSLRGSRTGVYTGLASSAYGVDRWHSSRELQGYWLTGGAGSVASGRVAYVLGLEGPAISIDTACSSSLVALHLACQALRRGECALALVGGATVMVRPGMFVEIGHQRGLAPDGRCKPFAQAADGTGWGEGVGVIAVERLEDARGNGRQVLAVVRGSAVNQDGASNGLTAPNGPSQQRVIHEALLDARLSERDIDAVEGHGTGTTLGDPIEAQALLATYGRDRAPDRPLWLGSVKSNIGHTQCAAGVAGVIKIVMALRHEALPKTLHLDGPSRKVDWAAGSVSLLSESVPWPRRGARSGDRDSRRAGISSFGIGGTNAHVILEEAPPVEEQAPAGEEARPGRETAASGAPQDVATEEAVVQGAVAPWVVSARSRHALGDQARRLFEHIAAAGDMSTREVGLELLDRASLEHRGVVWGSDREELLAGLDALARGAAAAGVSSGTVAPGAADGVVFVFPGQGSQWAGMAAELSDRSTVFAEALRECDAALGGLLGWSVEGVVRGAEDAPSLERVDVVQPVLFAVMVALARLWGACGVRPAAIVGHSQGEIAAACVAGGLSLADAARVVAVRSRALRALSGRGGMASVADTAAAVRARCERWGERVSIAAVNGPRAVVLAGEVAALEELVAEYERAGVRARLIPVDYAAHSEQVSAIREELLAGCSEIAPRSGQIPFYSAVSGGPLDTALLDGEYWYRNLREGVRFEHATRTLLQDGYRTFIEISPHPVLGMAVAETAEDALADETHAAAVATICSLRRGEGGARRFLASLGEAWMRGAEVDFRKLFAGGPARRVRLPTYAFQRKRYWLRELDGGGAGVSAAGLSGAGHPLLGAAVALADGDRWLFTGRLSLRSHAWLADHALDGVALLPGAALVELGLHAGRQVGCELLRELTLEAPLALSEEGVQLQIAVGERDERGSRSVSMHSRPESAEDGIDHAWVRNAAGLLGGAELAPDLAGGMSSTEDERPGAERSSREDALREDEWAGEEQWPPAGAAEIDVTETYAQLAASGLEYGPLFRSLRGMWRRGEETFAEVALVDELRADASLFGLHPALLDGALHAIAASAPARARRAEPSADAGAESLAEPSATGAGADRPRLPFAWAAVRLDVPGAAAARVRLRVAADGAVSLGISDEQGRRVGSVGSLRMRSISADRLRELRAGPRPPLWAIHWVAPTGGAASGPATTNVRSSAPGGASAKLPIVVDREALASLAQSLGAGSRVPAAVLADCTARASGETEVLGATHDAVARVLALLQTWLADERFSSSRLVIASSGAVAARGGERVLDLAGAAVWGLVRSAQLEHPGRFVLLDHDEAPSHPAALERSLALDEPQIAVRDGELLVPRLTRSVALEERAAFEPQGAVLITGAMGLLGALVARRLVREHGVRSVVLASRRGRDAEHAAELESELVSLGARVAVAACDVSDRAQIAALIDSIPAELPLRGVVHAAGVLDDGVIDLLSPARVDAVLAAKADAAWHLHELTAHLDLSAFVLFSSAAGMLGSPGQGAYAAANAFLDGLAAHRRAAGLAAVSVAWGPWAQASGMTAALNEVDRARLARAGFEPLREGEGLELFDAASRTREPVVLATRLNTAALRAQAGAGTLAGPLRGLIGAAARNAPGAGRPLARRLAGVPGSERERIALEEVRSQAAAILGYGSLAAVGPARAFKELGFDSLTAVELRNRLSEASGVRLPATLVFDHPNALAVTRYLLGELDGARPRPAAAHAAVKQEEPVAIVGMSCRYPGPGRPVSSPEELWELLIEAQDAITAFPTDRGWDLERPFDPCGPGCHSVAEGGFLQDVAEFDAAFFEIGPREALAMDPQQRQMLEACWEALEDAGIDPVTLRGAQTGVFAGVMSHDYATGAGTVPPAVESYLGVGGAGSVISGRVAYALGLEGPAITVDTACSSSLVALHLACQSLRGGECSLALAGGVTVLATPGVFAEFSRQGGLAANGRCKSFADGADGAGFSEGVGVVLLERLSDAQRNGHRVLGLVRGSAVNQDGASNGLTAPNGPSQERVIAQALANAGVAPAEVDAVEGHGTGTRLGDPIEAQALLGTYGRDRPAGRPLWLGSVKSNIGHAQAAAGVAGVIKMVMALQRERLPRTLHVEQPTREVDWAAGGVALLRKDVAWPRGERPRRVGVSSFGISGTNAHAILEEAPSEAPQDSHAGALVEDGGRDPGDRSLAEPEESVARALLAAGALPLVVSGKGAGALRAQARRLARFVEAPASGELVDVAHALVASRSRFANRAVVLGGDRGELVAALDTVARGAGEGAVFEGDGEGSGGVGYLFSGQGSQRAGMGSALYELFPVFAGALSEACELLDAQLGRPLRDVLFASADSSTAKLLDDTEFTQAGLFALQVALFRLLESFGLAPELLLGHSIGELAAAHVAGVLSLADACLLVAARGRLMSVLPAGGAMVAVQASEEEALAELGGLERTVALAAVNGPSAVVLSGEEREVVRLADSFASRGRKTSRLRVSHAFHSPRMDAMLEEFAAVAAGLSLAAPRIPIVSNVTGKLLTAEQACSPGYWVEHVRETVRFADGMRLPAARRAAGFVELGPGGALSALAQECLLQARVAAGAAQVDGAPLADAALRVPLCAPLLRGERPEARSLLEALARLHVDGVDVDFRALFGDRPARLVALPKYAFQRERYWLQRAAGTGDLLAAGQASAEHPLLAAVLDVADSEGLLFTGRLSLQSHPWLADHAVTGVVLLAGTALLELALHAGRQVGCDALAELTLLAPLVLGEQDELQLQLAVGEPDEEGRRAVDVYSRVVGGPAAAGDSARSWTHNAGGTLAHDAPPTELDGSRATPPGTIGRSWPPAGAEQVALEDLYERLAERGLEYGPAFRCLRAVWRSEEEIFAEVALSEEQRGESDRFGLHPGLLDAALQALVASPLGSVEEDGALRLPFAWSEVRLESTGASRLRVRLALADDGGISLRAVDAAGGPVLSVGSLALRAVAADQLAGAQGESARLLCVDWVPLADAPRAPDTQAAAPAILRAGALASALEAVGVRCVVSEDLVDLGRAAQDEAAAPAIVLAEGRGGASSLPAGVHACVRETLALLQEWLADERFAHAQLAIVSHGAVAVGPHEDVSDLAAAAAWGLVRSAQSEHPGRLLLIDVDGTQASWQALMAAVRCGEPQVAIREGALLVARLASAGSTGALGIPADAARWGLQVGGGGSLDELELLARPASDDPPGPGEVRVAVRAAGINFRDVLIALGVYPGPASIGGEGAGVVLEVGAGVDELRPGDRVMGMLAEAFGPVASGDGALLRRMPHGWSFAQAAAVPVASLTAHFALVDLAELRAGQRLLIHAATGGVGMAALQLARHIGAEVFVTASPGKWGVLERMGCEPSHVASSRTPEFRERFLRATDGRGMDVVLDCLAHELVDASLELLPRGGRFIEMGKTDIRDPAEVARRYPGVRYRAFDLTEAGPGRIGEMLTELLALFERGTLTPPPVRGWDVRRAREAFRFMSQARHFGKNVLRIPATPGRWSGTALITGGTGGLGALLARHLVGAHGMRSLMLVSRGGAQAPGAQELARELTELGAEVQLRACDVTDRQQLSELLAQIPREHPLSVVVHAAGVLDDGVLAALDDARLERVLAPKVDGAWHLHELTRELDLRAFVLFSSAAATFGGAGQANYAAANAFLDALAIHRRALGLPATSMAWGQWAAETAMTGELGAADLARLARAGIAALTRAQGLELFDAACEREEALLLPVRLNTAALRARAGAGELAPLLGNLIGHASAPRAARRARSSVDLSLAQRLAGAGDGERSRIVLDLVRGQTADALGHATATAVGARQSFKELGLDSLAAVELRNRIALVTGLRLPATALFDHPTPLQLAEHLQELLTAEGDTGRATDPNSLEPVERDLAAIERRLSSIATDDAGRTRIAARLQTLLSLLGARAVEDDEDVQSASAADVFALIDRELGS